MIRAGARIAARLGAGGMPSMSRRRGKCRAASTTRTARCWRGTSAGGIAGRDGRAGKADRAGRRPDRVRQARGHLARDLRPERAVPRWEILVQGLDAEPLSRGGPRCDGAGGAPSRRVEARSARHPERNVMPRRNTRCERQVRAGCEFSRVRRGPVVLGGWSAWRLHDARRRLAAHHRRQLRLGRRRPAHEGEPGTAGFGGPVHPAR